MRDMEKYENIMAGLKSTEELPACHCGLAMTGLKCCLVMPKPQSSYIEQVIWTPE